jgi:ParB-like chromosome segregation protein Spo0J
MATKKATVAPSSGVATSGAFNFETADVPLTKLLLDPNNYRFLDHKKFKKKVVTRFHEDKVQAATLENLEHHYNLDELKNSILVNGYVPMERIIVAPYKHLPGHYVVVEGNRRVAALKSLLKECEEGVIALTAAQKKSYARVPCAVLKSAGKDLRHAERVIMGIRHIAGPKEWGAYQQALLVAELKDEEDLDFKDIGGMLGISSVEAARRYRAIAALKFMEQDELYGDKAEPNFYRLLHEMVSSPEVRERFGWSHEQNTFTDVEQAREFFQLLTGDAKHDPKLTTYSDVRRLKLIVGNQLAVASLLDPDQSLVEAIRISENGKIGSSPGEVLEDVYKALARISISQAKAFTDKELTALEQIVDTIDGLKSLAKTAK